MKRMAWVLIVLVTALLPAGSAVQGEALVDREEAVRRIDALVLQHGIQMDIVNDSGYVPVTEEEFEQILSDLPDPESVMRETMGAAAVSPSGWAMGTYGLSAMSLIEQEGYLYTTAGYCALATVEHDRAFIGPGWARFLSVDQITPTHTYDGPGEFTAAFAGEPQVLIDPLGLTCTIAGTIQWKCVVDANGFVFTLSNFFSFSDTYQAEQLMLIE